MKAKWPIVYILLLADLFFGPHAFVLAQHLSGNIRDNKSNQPVIGAVLVVKGSSVATSTDANGDFSIDVPSPPFYLVISNLGYTTMEYEVTNLEKPLTIKM